MAEKTYYSNVLTSVWFWRQHCSTGELRHMCWDWRHWRHVVILLHSTVLTLHTIIREPGSWSWHVRHVRHVTMGDQGAGACPWWAHVCKCSTRTWHQYEVSATTVIHIYIFIIKTIFLCHWTSCFNMIFWESTSRSQHCQQHHQHYSSQSLTWEDDLTWHVVQTETQDYATVHSSTPYSKQCEKCFFF